MKIKFVFIMAVLLFGLTTYAMSSDTPDDLAINDGLVKLAKESPHRITEEELHNIAINYYHYIFEEEHEWKGIRVDSSKSVIKDIFSYEENGIIFFYTINYYPDGHTLIPAYDFVSKPGYKNGGGWARKLTNKKDTKKMSFVAKRGLASIRKKTLLGLQNKHVQSEKKRKWWDKFNVQSDKFNEKVIYENNTYQPDWWLKKNFKNSKNIEGMIKTEWYQN